MTKLQKFIAMLEKFDDDLGIWGDLIGGLSLVVIGMGLFVFVPLIAG